MHNFLPYVDLRQNTGKAEVNDSLWPTFTDIMAVVLMIFMLSMIMIIIRNTDLARQLQTVEESLQKSQLARSDLRSQVAEIEEDLRKKEMEIILLGDENQFVKSTLEGKLAIITALESDLSNLKEKTRGLEEDISAKEQYLVKLQSEKEREIAGIKEQHESEIVKLTEEMEKKIEEFNSKFSALAQVINEREGTILVLNRKQEELSLTLARQRRDYTVIEEKYNKLLRPARSPSGKNVVTISYFRRGKEYPILFKDIDSETYEEIEESQLHKKLGDLKERLKDKLYVKIIIPEDSNLSYNEAWTFTRDILSRYDYYHQNE
jgi:chromosome segregation ATPase